MTEIEVQPIPRDVSVAVRSISSAMGLMISADGELRKYPGSQHWHLKKPGKTGTLEITHWPARQRLWICYHTNRVGDGWVDKAAAEIATLLASSSQVNQK